MEIRFRGLHYDLPERVTSRAQKKLMALAKYAGRDAENARAYVELGKISEAHQSGPIWQARMDFSYPGMSFRAEATEETIENAIDEAVGELAKEVSSARKRQMSLARRGGLLFKSFTQRMA